LNKFPTDLTLFDSLEWQKLQILNTQHLKVINQNSSAKKLLNDFSSAINFRIIEIFFINIIDRFSIYCARKLFCVGGNNFYYFHSFFQSAHINKISNEFSTFHIFNSKYMATLRPSVQKCFIYGAILKGKKIDPFYPTGHSKWNEKYVKIFYLPTTSISPETKVVWKVGASTLTSQVYLPDMLVSTWDIITWLAFDFAFCHDELFVFFLCERKNKVKILNS
jgi:hypothetical protein